MIAAEKCRHPKLNFGSGDYYIFCHDCGRWWVTIEPTSHKLAPELANQGEGSQLSGQSRVDVGTVGETKT
jgi:hypothetical protein